MLAERIPALFCAWPAVVTHGLWRLENGYLLASGPSSMAKRGSLLAFVDRNSRAAGSQRHGRWTGCQWIIGGLDKQKSTQLPSSGGSYPHIKGLSGFLCLPSGFQPFCSNAPTCTPSCPPARLLCAPSCIPASCFNLVASFSRSPLTLCFSNPVVHCSIWHLKGMA